MHDERNASDLHWRARLGLLLVLACLVGVFWAAIQIRPRDNQGEPLMMESHTQLGLKPCSFRVMTGKPCPTCGMTTSFAHLVRGDVVNSMRANFAGSILAVICLVAVPWCIVSVVRGRMIWIRSINRAFIWIAGGMILLTSIRWIVLIGIPWMVER